jgi:DNA-binding transcriptional regulator YdaS (Cro superfamily)
LPDMETINAIQRACEIIGGTNALARVAGVTPPTASQWKKGTRPVPSGRCPSIERATRGAITCEELRPDFDWKYLSDRTPAKKEAA